MNTTHALWVAYGSGGVIGTIRRQDEEYTVTMAGADNVLGTYPTMEIAKSALHSQLPISADWPSFRQH